MVREVKIKIYKFNELGKEVQEKLVEQEAERQGDWFMNEAEYHLKDHIIEECEKNKVKTDLVSKGLGFMKEIKIKNYDLDNPGRGNLFFEGNVKYKNKEVSIEIQKGEYRTFPKVVVLTSGEFVWTNIDKVCQDDKGEENEFLSVFFDEFHDLYRKICDEAEKKTYNDYLEESSNKAAKEILEESEDEYYPDGRVY